MIRGVPRRTTESRYSAFDRRDVFNGQMSYLINWIHTSGTCRGLHLNRCKMFRPRPNMCKLRRALSEYHPRKNAISSPNSNYGRASLCVKFSTFSFSRGKSEFQIELQIKDFSFTEVKHNNHSLTRTFFFFF